MSYKEYMQFVPAYYKNEKLLSSADYENLSGYYVTLTKSDYVDSIASKGKDKLIEHFFDDCYRYKLNYQEYFEIVIGKLFDRGILVANVEGGEVIIYRSPCY